MEIYHAGHFNRNPARSRQGDLCGGVVLRIGRHDAEPSRIAPQKSPPWRGAEHSEAGWVLQRLNPPHPDASKHLSQEEN